MITNQQGITEQYQYELYTVEDPEAWSALFNRQVKVAANTANAIYQNKFQEQYYVPEALGNLNESILSWIIS
jgi:hypothetical protein